MFRDEKVTQMAASFVRLAGGKINYLLLTKMLYVADKQMLLKYHTPMSNDDWYSLEHGPVLSMTLNYIREKTHSEYWSAHLKTSGLELILTTDPGNDELSRAEDRVIADVYEDWGHLQPFEARDRTHSRDEFPEWSDPGKGRIPIGYHEVLRLYNSTPPEIAKILDQIDSHNNLMELAGVR